MYLYIKLPEIPNQNFNFEMLFHKHFYIFPVPKAKKLSHLKYIQQWGSDRELNVLYTSHDSDREQLVVLYPSPLLYTKYEK